MVYNYIQVLVLCLGVAWRSYAVEYIANFSVHYASWFTAYNTSDNYFQNVTDYSLITNWTKLIVPSNTDDAPYEEVALSFPFPLLGINQYAAYVGANGILLFETEVIPPCNSFCNPVMNYYYGSISGLTTDWNPAQSSKTFIGYYSTSDYIIFRFSDLEYYGISFSKNTFYIKLRSDGLVRIYYEDITFPNQLIPLFGNDPNIPLYVIPTYEGWLSGIRQYFSLPEYYTTSFGQYVDMVSWNQTAINGVYPNNNLMQSYAVWTACPISDLWCLNLRYFNLTSSLNTISNVNLKLTSLTPLSCLDNFIGYQCVLKLLIGANPNATISFPATFIPNSSFSCTLTPGILSTILSAFPTGSDRFQTFIGLSAVLSHDSYAPGQTTLTQNTVEILSPSIGLTFVNTIINTNILKNAPVCSLTTAARETQSSLLCSECDICNESLDCFYDNSTCPVEQNLYTYPDCGNNCNISLALPDLTSYSSLDRNGSCCPIDSIDCSGVCYGTNKVGVIVVRGTIDGAFKFYLQESCCSEVDCRGVCSGEAKEDCAGVCEGLATYDDCGICSGGTTGLSPTPVELCTPAVDVYPFDPKTPINPNITYQTPVVPSNSQDSVELTVFNPSSYIVRITLSVVETNSNNDPVVNLNTTTYKLLPNQTFTSSISVSLYRFLNGNVSSWEVKYVRVRSQRLNFFSTVRRIDIPIYPSVMNCEGIKSQRICSSAPKCSLCFVSDSYRILFDRVVPTTSNPDNEPLTTYCATGSTSTEACTQFPDLVSPEPGRYYWWIILFCFLMTIVVSVLVFAIYRKL